MEFLECDRCGAVYDDQASIQMAKQLAHRWAEACRDDGVEPRGLIGCPIWNCPGEMVLKTPKAEAVNPRS